MASRRSPPNTPVPLPRPNPERQFEREYMDNVIGGMFDMGMGSAPNGNGAYTPPGLQPQQPPIGREELDALIQQLLQPNVYDERGFVPGKDQSEGGMLPPTGYIPNTIMRAPPPANDEEGEFPQTAPPYEQRDV